MKTQAAVLLLAAAACSHAAGVKRPPHLTGDQFVVQFRGGPDIHVYDQRYAQGYLAGVVDATQGRTWCASERLTPAETDSEVVSELVKQPRGSMLGIASALLLEQYTSKFPVTGSACTFKPYLSGDQFVTWLIGDLRTPGVSKWDQSPEVSNKQRYAEGYVGGVVDATQGSSWCATRRIKPDELDERGWRDLIDRPRGSMPGSAATLLLEQFTVQYPCKPL